MSTGTAATASHPSPHRHRVGLGRLMLGMFGAPAAWNAQLLANYGRASLLCFPHQVPHLGPPESWPGPWIELFVVNVAALAVAAFCAYVSYANWGATRAEQPGASHRLLEAGEGRARFFAIVGILTSVGFLAAVLFNTVALVAVPPCYD